jgi:hypothetical protein
MSFNLKHVQVTPPEVMWLQRELKNHPELSAQCIKEARDFEESLAMIATYCGIIVDGYYDVPEMCEVLTKALQAKRLVVVNSPIILPH